jgi:RNA polymerase sigma factor (TIGR02999 family)
VGTFKTAGTASLIRVSDSAALSGPIYASPWAPCYNVWMSDVTRILYAIEDGDAKASAELLPLVYDQLRKTAQQRMASERTDHSLNATALVHEAYLKLVGSDAASLQWANRAHFFAAAAEAMRRILVDHARAKGRLKRGGRLAKLTLNVALLGAEEQAEETVALDEVLRRLEEQDPRMARIVSLRFFAGLSVEETALALDLSPRTVKRDWSTARAWLYREMRSDGD